MKSYGFQFCFLDYDVAAVVFYEDDYVSYFYSEPFADFLSEGYSEAWLNSAVVHYAIHVCEDGKLANDTMW